MDLHLRFGMHKNVSTIHEESECINGVVIPSHILAYQTPSTSAFITSLKPEGCAYILDPMTFVFQNRKDRITKKDDDGGSYIRPSIGDLCTEYHHDLAGLVESLEGPDDRIHPGDIPDIEEIAENVATFQLNAVSDGADQSAASKYLDRYDDYTVSTPRFIIPPYFRFASLDSEWYRLSLVAANALSGQDYEAPLAPVICCPPDVLNRENIQQIVQDYNSFENVIIWIDGYREKYTHSHHIRRVREFISQLDAGVDHVESLYGGFLMLMSFSDGLEGISHGILYTQGKDYELTPGSGGAPERFYIPQLHQFRSLSQTSYIFSRCPELVCDCVICRKSHRDDPQELIVEYDENPDLLRRHFLRVRRSELQDVPGRGIHDVLDELEGTYNQYHDILTDIPNPDAITNANMPGLSYIREWLAAFGRTVN